MTTHKARLSDTSTSRTASIRSSTPCHSQSHRVTRMLILVSTCFLLLNAPSHICNIGMKIYLSQSAQSTNHVDRMDVHRLNETSSMSNEVTWTPQPQMWKVNVQLYLLLYIVVIITHHISYLSYSINFFLYSFCGMKFRREVMRFLSTCFGHCYRRESPPIITTTRHSN